MNFDPELFKALILFADGSRQLPHPGDKGAAPLVRQQSDGLAQEGKAHVAPIGFFEQAQQETEAAFNFLFSLKRARIIIGPAEDPSIVGSDQELLQENLFEKFIFFG